MKNCGTSYDLLKINGQIIVIYGEIIVNCHCDILISFSLGSFILSFPLKKNKKQKL